MKPENYPTGPQHIWEQFYQISQIPRPSKSEHKVIDYLMKLASEQGLEYKIDEANNVVIYVPASEGRESEESVIIQNHMDMVTDAAIGVEFDFKTQPINLEVRDGWVGAKKTTLGADNGIGCAAALAVILDKDVSHPPLELLFTSDEETGLHGALNLDVSMLSGKKMLNLDTEEWGSLYIGCAGGIDYEMVGQMQAESLGQDLAYLKLSVGALVGGHSGIDIHRGRGNAIKILGELLFEIEREFQLCEFRGGRAHNIIPRDAFAILAVKKGEEVKIASIAEEYLKKLKGYLPREDKGVDIDCQVIHTGPKHALTKEETKRFIQLVNLFPHGQHAVDQNFEEPIVSMSNNLAKVLLVDSKFYAQASLRFFDRNEVRSIEKKLKILAENNHFDLTNNSEYPSWKPVPQNSVLDKVKEVYQNLHGEIPIVTAIHAGLECGILKDKIGEIDIVSFGPTITGAHSPDEKVDIKSVEKFWNLFTEVLKVI